MDYWAELRTAMVVGKLGSVSAASAELGLHRATVTRHIEVVESQFGICLFLRHARGVHLTDFGKEIFEVARQIESQLTGLRGKIKNKRAKMSGDLVITSLAGTAPLIMPAIKRYKDAHPDVSITHLSGEARLRLEFGEAHVAIRASQKPTEPDYIAKPFRPVQFGLYGHRDYLSEATKPFAGKDLSRLKVIGPTTEELHQPFARWIAGLNANLAFSIKVDSQDAVLPAILAGLGAGFVTDYQAAPYSELVEIIPPAENTSIQLWIAIHRDLNQVAKVKEFVRTLTTPYGDLAKALRR
ncbi:MAG: LysR family transcriptional regulator [Pseudomonadota bacterium]